jgi:hypothetical protein
VPQASRCNTIQARGGRGNMGSGLFGTLGL